MPSSGETPQDKEIRETKQDATEQIADLKGEIEEMAVTAPDLSKPFYERYFGENPGETFENSPDYSNYYTIRIFSRLNVADLNKGIDVQEYNLIVQGMVDIFMGKTPDGLSAEEQQEFTRERDDLLGDMGPFYVSGGNYKEGGVIKSDRAMRLSVFVLNDKNGIKIPSGARIQLADRMAEFLKTYMRFKAEDCKPFKQRLRAGVDLDNQEFVGLEPVGTIAARYTDKFSRDLYGGNEMQVRKFILLNTILFTELNAALPPKDAGRPRGHMRNIRAMIDGNWKNHDTDPLEAFEKDLEEHCPTWQGLSETQKSMYWGWLLPEDGRNDWFHLTADTFSGSTAK